MQSIILQWFTTILRELRTTNVFKGVYQSVNGIITPDITQEFVKILLVGNRVNPA